SNRIQKLLQLRLHHLLPGPATAAPRPRTRGMSKIGKMIPLSLAKPQRTSQSIEDLQRHPTQITTFHPRVILHADTRQHGHLLPAQPRHPPSSAADDPGLLRSDPVPARAQEVRNLCPMVHTPTLTTHSRSWEELPVHRSKSPL